MLTLTGIQISSLKDLAQVPKTLNISGDGFEKLLTRPKLTVVGSRKVTPYGRAVTQNLVSNLARRGVVIISGLAYGVDSVAHQACLDSDGQTIAVLPSGLGRIYPTAHTNLARQICDKGGALVSEYEADEAPYKHYFIARNRIMAALGDGVLITEAAERSGSLHTVNFALELGKPVFVVPGNITSPLSAGCNNLLKIGAIPATSINDILQAMNWTSDDVTTKDIVVDSEQERVIVDLLKEGTSDGIELLNRSKLSAADFNQAMTMLEISGHIHATGANHWSL